MKKRKLRPCVEKALMCVFVLSAILTGSVDYIENLWGVLTWAIFATTAWGSFKILDKYGDIYDE